MKPSVAVMLKMFHQSNLIEGFDNREMDNLSVFAWETIVDTPLESMTNELICDAQKSIVSIQKELQDNWRGFYRSESKQDVWIGGRKGMAPEQIDLAMDNWLECLPIIDPVQGHIDFEHIHPFVDGNGRTGRLLLWWQQYKLGLPFSDITYAKRWEYYDWFK